MDVSANSFEEAEEKASEMCKDYYHLNVVNAYHDSKETKIDIQLKWLRWTGTFTLLANQHLLH